MRVSVDGRVLQDRYHGIGRHTFEVLRQLASPELSAGVPGGLELVVAVPPDSGRLDLAPLREAPGVRLVRSDAPVVGAAAQLAMTALVKQFRPDVHFSPYHLTVPLLHGRVPVVSVVHDCIFERQADLAPGRRAFQQAYRTATRLTIAASRRVATISEATRADLLRFYGLDVPEDAILRHGVGEQFFRAGTVEAGTDGAERLRAAARAACPGLPDRYVLHVGVRRPHKNQRTLVEALSRLAPELDDVALVLVGQVDERFADGVDERVRELGLGHRVFQLSRVDDRALLALYAGASVFAFPSLVEGFGLPVLEAMAAGVPVVASDAEAVVEAAAGAALVVPALDVDAWVKSIDEVLRDDAVAADLVRRGGRVAHRHTWTGSARRTLDLLARSCGRSPAAVT